jgi:hopanoid biosynthesis associated RND transporter like protein HpnN
MKIVSRLLQRWTDWVIIRPRLVLACVFITAWASIYITLSRLDVVTDQLELISRSHPLITLTHRLNAFKSNESTFTVVVKVPTPQRAVAYANVLADRIQKDSVHFKEVFYRINPEQAKPWAFYYLEPEQIREIHDNLKNHADLIRSLAEKQDLLAFLNQLNRSMASRMVGEMFTGFLDEPAQETPKKAEHQENLDLSPLIVTLDGLSAYLKGDSGYKSPWASLFQNGGVDLDLEGYLWEGNRKYLLLMVFPKEVGEGFNELQGSLNQLRTLIRETQGEFPDIEVGVTGQDALTHDEISTVLDDMVLATWLSLGGVLLLMILFFRSLRRPLVELSSLMVGLCWTFGWTTIFIGHLNILSVVFAPLLCGLGVDYGIHWLARYEEESRHGGRDTRTIVRLVTASSGPGIFLAGLSAAFSFLPFVLTGFRGLMELGVITGAGIILTLIADFTVLPALAPILAKRGLDRRAPRKPFWQTESNMMRISPRTARWVLALTAVASVLSYWSSMRVNFDLNPLRLQAANAESVIWEKNMIEHSERSVMTASMIASSPEEVAARVKALEQLPSVSEAESIYSFLPRDQKNKTALLHSLLRFIPEVKPAVLTNRVSDINELSQILERIRFKMQSSEAASAGAGEDLLVQMKAVRSLIEEIKRSLADSSESPERFFEYRKLFRDDLLSTWEMMRKAASAKPMTITNLPQSLRDWFYQDGKFLIRIYPRQSIWEEEALKQFVLELQSVDPDVVGDPVSLYTFATAYKKACLKASTYALVAVGILLFLGLRRISLTLLALTPLAFGTLWTIGIMGAANLNFNLANSMFMPLVVGAGVEYAIVIIHRWKEGDLPPGAIPLSTLKGVLLAALTTTVGFGMLMISHHRGIFSLGFVAWAGSLCVLVAAVLLLPSLLMNLNPPGFTHARRTYR